MSENGHPGQQLIDKPEHAGLEFPPKIFLDMEAEMLEYIEGQSLRVRFPVKERYQNPAGHMQGGMIVTAADNTLGPLSFLAIAPNVTTQLNTSFIRPVTRDDASIEVLATITDRTRRQIFMTAQVMNPAGKVVALCHATCMLLGE